MEINEYQRAAMSTRQRPAKILDGDPIISLLGLAGEAGQLLSEYKKYLRDGDAYRPFKERVREELGDIMWYVASSADEFGLSLSEVASSNLMKCYERFGNAQSSSFPTFDQKFPEAERFPRRLTVSLVSGGTDGRRTLRMLLEDGSPLGDDLTDNAYEEDGYRFHDVFHLACMATLGWSPVMRKLLHRKRRSNANTNEVEDGGRATAIEEGISALVFSYASDHSHLDGIEKIDYELLRTMQGMARHLEVSACTPRDWERTIFATFSVWRAVSRRPSAILLLDLDERTLTVND